MKTPIFLLVLILNFVNANAQEATIIDSTTLLNTRSILLKFLGGKINIDNAFHKLSGNKAYIGMITMSVGDDELLSELHFSSEFMNSIMANEKIILAQSRNTNLKFPGMKGKHLLLQLMFRYGRDETITNLKDFDADFRKSLALISKENKGEYIFLQPKVYYFLRNVDKSY
jgi:hypothetical protein